MSVHQSLKTRLTLAPTPPEYRLDPRTERPLSPNAIAHYDRTAIYLVPPIWDYSLEDYDRLRKRGYRRRMRDLLRDHGSDILKPQPLSTLIKEPFADRLLRRPVFARFMVPGQSVFIPSSLNPLLISVSLKHRQRRKPFDGPRFKFRATRETEDGVILDPEDPSGKLGCRFFAVPGPRSNAQGLPDEDNKEQTNNLTSNINEVCF